MKKRILALALALAMVMTMFAACGKKEDEEKATAKPVANNEEAAKKGEVKMLNFKPEQDEAFKEAAEAFTKETGIKVTVETAASNEYESTLKTKMTSKDDMPSLFTINGPMGYNAWKEYCADITELDLVKKVTDQGYLVKNGDKVFGVANCVEGYGIIYNNGIIKKYCETEGAVITSVDDIKSFEIFEKVCKDMDAKKADLGIDAVFASTTLEHSDDWRWKTHLNNIPLYYEFKEDGITGTVDEIKFSKNEAFKRLFDLYLAYDIKDERDKSTDDAMVQLAKGRCVFAQNGTWAWGTIEKTEGNVVAPEDCGFLPFFCGEDDANAGICAGTENFFAINSKVSDEDQAATVQFLTWLYTTDKGMDIVKNKLQFIAPFNNFKAETSPNPLINQLAADSAAGKVIPWKFQVIPSEAWKDVFGANLKAYAEGSMSWDEVVESYKTEWADAMALLKK